MNQYKYKLVTVLTVLIVFTACSLSDDSPGGPEIPAGGYADGIFILNEGNFGSGNATISFLDASWEELVHNVFSGSNEGKSLGDVGQSMGFHKEYAFVVMNASNTVVVVNRNTFEEITTIDVGLHNPRYIAFSNEKAFVTNWGDGANPGDDYVSVFDADTFEQQGQIAVSEGPEKIVPGGGKIFVAHTGGFNFNNTVSVLDPLTQELITTIQVGDVPNSLMNDGTYLWVLSGGKPAYSGEETGGSLAKIDMGTYEILKQLSFPNVSDHPAHLEHSGESFYYAMGNTVFQYGENDQMLPETPLFEMGQVNYLYGFEVQQEMIYATSTSEDFISNGKLFIHDLTGNLLETFETGINPNGIYFNN